MEEVDLPLSAGKMAAALAISLVDRAYCLGAVTDDRRQILLQALRNLQADLVRAEGSLIEGSLLFDSSVLRNVNRRIWQFRNTVEEIEDTIDKVNYRRLEGEVGNPISKLVKRKIVNKGKRFDIPSRNMRRLENALADLETCHSFGYYFELLRVGDNPPFADHERYGYYPSWIATVKWMVAFAISLLDRAYCLDVVSDREREELFQNLQNLQADLVRAEGSLIRGSLPFDSSMLHIRQLRNTFQLIHTISMDYRRLMRKEGNPISNLVKRKIVSKFNSFDIWKSNMNRLENALADLEKTYQLFENHSVLLSAAGHERYGYPSWIATAEGVYSREREKEDLVQWLIKDNTAEGNPLCLSVCALVGDRGVGKTAIANTVREDPRVLANFDFIVWFPENHEYVLPLRFFYPTQILTVILETITGETCSLSSLECSLMEQLRDKKLLLILDDVIENSTNEWETFVAPLKVCKKGSKILMTTQLPSVVAAAGNALGAAAHVIKLQLLSQVGSEDYPESSSRVPSSSPRHNSYPSWISNGGIFGRDRETEQLVQWLTMDTDQDNPFSAYALVGMAGMGKTTLANIVCQDLRVSANFKAVVWVPVPVDFDTEAIARFIFQKIIGRRPAYSSMNLLQNSLTETLRYRKVLLILDDVWEDRSVEKWQTLVAPLRVCKKGSKILLMTRMQSVVDMTAVAVGAQVKYLKIDELNENDNLSLFKSRLPSQVDSEDYDDLMLIGEQIMKKIGGCPLVTSLVASWLGSHMDTHSWNMVLQKGWQHLDGKYIVLASLRLSYDLLPTELQTCFRYCSLFPKGYKFNKVELAKMWAGSGLIPFSSSKLENIDLHKTKYLDLLSAEDAGEEHFDLLARKSFFCCMLETEISDGNQKEYYVLHGLMHDLAQYVSTDECARIYDGDLRSISIRTRHLSIAPCSNLGVICRHLLEIYRKQQESSGFTNLRTLIIQIEFGLDQETELVLEELLKNSRSLRLLYLGMPSMSHVLDSLPSLIHLRYLFLFSCDEFQLQKVFKLYHLQVLQLEYLIGKKANCTGIQNLYCLRCLHVPDNMSSSIHQIGRLTVLQELHGFEIVENGGQRLSALGKLRSLSQLTLRNLQNVLNFKEAVDIRLKEKYYLKLLSLSWNKNLTDSVDQDGRIIDNLEPNKELQLLHIYGYSGVKLPVWIENSSLIHLVSLELEYCMKWKSLPSFKELTSLKHLKLENLFQLEYIGTVIEQQLETNESEKAWLPPFLSTLTVQWCPNLKELPDIPCTLELLIIKHVQLADLPAILQTYTGGGGSAPAKSQLGFLHIESCAQLTSLSTGLLEQKEQLHSLETLVLRHCERLHHLPTRGFAELHHLNSLEIVACPILKDLKTEDHLLPVSLRNLDLNPCGDINVSFLMSLQNLTAIRRLIIFACTNVEELPSVEVFRTLNSLNDVSIARCKKLLSLGGLGAVASLRILSILCCDKLTSSYATQVICTCKLQKLTIDRQTLLLVEPLRSLRHTRELHIRDDYAMGSLPWEWFLQNAVSLHSIEVGIADSLCSLPSEMDKLGSLKSLHIERAPLLQSLPQLPASLCTLTIWGCDPRFLKNYERDVGSDWGKIAHIANVDIQSIPEDTNYGDDQSQGLLTSTGNPYRKYIVID